MAIPDDRVSFDEASFIEPVADHQGRGKSARGCGRDSGGHGARADWAAARDALELGATRNWQRSDAEQRAKALSLGLDFVVDPREGPLAEKISSRTRGRGADVALVAVPIPSALKDALGIVRPGGRVLLFAQNDPQMKIEFPAAAVGVEEKEILGSYSAAIDRASDAAQLIFTHRLPVKNLISHRFSLEDMGRALQLAARPVGDSLKVVIHP